ncbi:MAG: Holliday junction branch migration protein RuvA [Lachnospiraceae bacterium]|nr:Holliday junction branch migration protein RuvA [Lachnospiraceae bacterium]MBP3608924.1 Holliday junction branch migration protein RuvA [Lachnospiraceae bacterium]
MIAFIEGTLVKKTVSTVVVATASGLGYELFVPVTDIQQMPANGSKVLLHTHLQVKEDGVALFGFLTEEALQVFKLLITVSGIGPKGAIGILSGISLDDLRFAVLAEDTKTISKIPGIGAKTAGKLVLELKDKFKLEDAVEAKLAHGEAAAGASSQTNHAAAIREEAAQALAALGYSMTEALKVLRNVEVTETTTVEELLKVGLKNL